MLPFTNIPILEAPPIPPKKPRGIDITKAQGQDTTKKDKALYSQFVKVSHPKKKGGTKANISAMITTVGV